MNRDDSRTEVDGTQGGSVATIGDLAEGRLPQPLLAPRPLSP